MPYAHVGSARAAGTVASARASGLTGGRPSNMASSYGTGPLRAVSDLRRDGARPQAPAVVWSSHPYVVVGEVRLVGSHAAVLTQAKPAAFLRRLGSHGILAP